MGNDNFEDIAGVVAQASAQTKIGFDEDPSSEVSIGNKEGVNPIDPDTLDKMLEALEQIQEAITGMSKEGAAGMQDKVGTKAESVLGNPDAKEKDKEDSDEKKQKPGDGKPKLGLKIGINDISNMAAKDVMGALLINSTLIAMQDTLTNILKAINKKSGNTIAGAKKVNVDSSTKVDNSTKINIDPKQLSGMSKAMLEFGKAALIMAIIPFPIVNLGLKVFTKFVDTMIGWSNKLKKSGKDLLDMAKAMSTIVNTMKQFGLACLILAITLPAAIISLVSLGIMAIWLFALIGIGTLAKGAEKPIASLVKSMIQAGIAFILFGIVAIIAVKAGKQAKEALIGLAVITGFVLAFVLLGLLCMIPYVGVALASFAGTSIALAIGVLLFTLAVNLISKIKIDKAKLQEFVSGVTLIVTTFAQLASTITLGLVSVLLFSLFSILLLVGMLAFTLSVVLMMATNAMLDKLGADKVAQGGELAVTTKIKGVIASFANKEFLKSIALGMVAMIPFTIFSLLFAVAMLLFTLGVVFLFLSDMLLQSLRWEEPDENGNKIPTAIKEIMGMSAAIGKNIGWFLLGAIAMIPATVFAVLFTVFSLAILIGVAAMYETDKIMQKMDDKSLIATGKKIKSAVLGIMFGFLGLEYTPGKDVGVGDIAKGALNAVKMAALGAEAVLAVAPAVLFMLSIVSIAESIKWLNENFKGVDEAMLQTLFGVIGMLMEKMGDMAQAFKGTSAKMVAALGELVKDVAEAIDKLTDIVIKLKDGIPEDQIDNATHAILMICQKLFGDPDQNPKKGEYTLMSLFTTLANGKLKNLNEEACKAIVPIIEGIDRLADLVIKLGDPELTKGVPLGIENFKQINKLMDDVADVMMNLVTKHKTGWFSSSSPLDAINTVASSSFFDDLSSVFDKLKESAQSAEGIKLDGLQNLITFLQSPGLDNGIVSKLENFKSIFSIFSKAMDSISAQSVSNLNGILSALQGANSAKIVSTIETLSQLGKMATEFKKTADAFDRIEKALSKMATHESKISKMFNSMKDASKKANSGDLEKSTNAAIGGSGLEGYVEGIYTMLNDWDTNGIPVRAQINQATGEILPKDAGNETGKGGGRK